MKNIITALIFIIGFHIQSYSQTYKIQDNIKRIIFIGNSITYSGEYIANIDAYLAIKYPEKHYKIINVGLPSETVSGLSEKNHAGGKFVRPDLHERLTRILNKTNPDLVLACYGMNDGIYMPFDDNRFKKYKDGINWLNDEVKKSGSEIIHITPPIYDERKGKAYANVLDIYSDWLISNRYTSNWNVIDIHWPMKKELEIRRDSDPSFVFSKDGVHPNKTGHFLIAKQILLYFREKDIKEISDFNNFLSRYESGEQIFSYVKERQKLMKDAWLTFIGHKRPNMEIGVPIDEAKEKLNTIELKIKSLIK